MWSGEEGVEWGGGCGVGRGAHISTDQLQNKNNNLFEFDFERFDSYYLELLMIYKITTRSTKAHTRM